ncbi:hypothetical protein PHYPSEUDO_012132 [Phytophthora pseudosyringae]|uniref:Lebercilin domain-containing protein n=1 Tax=Phytophthora pseudosyringae TaxID=221518 RepID=A0A8T1VAM5_9STRA|nr:hypothetical protein PHYPSEUDO_012132 [Phytophthora pseudosyringae]
MARQYVGTEASQSSPWLEINGEVFEERDRRLNSEGILDDGEEDGIDLEGYEEYLEHLKSKAGIRPCSARVIRPIPTEPPRLFMINANNPVPTRPVRPVSARPRMRSTPRSSLDDRTLNGYQSRSSGVGVRRKRQGEKMVHARIRAVYNDVGRSSLSTKQMAAPYSAASALNSKSGAFQEAEIHDEYYRLLDAESELKAACLQEQQKRVKAVANVRRLEEIIAMKDKKIESLLHAKAVGADRSLSMNGSIAQRELAERARQFHALTQKLRQKIAQQSQLLSSYEEAMQSLRSGIKSTNLMELDEERSQLYEELRHHQELLNRQRFEWEALQQKLGAFADAEASSKLQITKLLQENKIISHEKRKLEKEVGYLKSRVGLIQCNLTLEQRKRTYDREFSESVGKRTASSPTQKEMLAQALEEMKKLMRRETMASIKREKLKSPKAGTFPQRPDAFPPPATNKSATTAQSTVPTPAPKPPSRSAVTSLATPRASSAANTHSQGAAARQTASGNGDYRTKIDSTSAAAPATTTLPVAIASSASQDQSKHFDLHKTGHDETKEALVVIHVEPGESRSSTHRYNPQWQHSHQAGNHDASEKEICPATAENGQLLTEDVHCTPAVGQPGAGQITNEEWLEMQYQTCTTTQSTLQLTASTLELGDSDDLDSASSADMLDDAQHLRNDPDMENIGYIDDVADAALISFEVPKEEAVDMEEEAPSSLPLVASTVEDAAQEESQDEGGQLSQAFDDLYASDFLDTDAQASMEDSEDAEEAT